MSRRQRLPTPTTFFNPNLPGGLGTFVFANFSNPVAFICSAIGGVENATATETGKLCAQYLGPALRQLSFNMLPQPPLNPYLMPAVTPDKLAYSDPALAPDGAGAPPGPPEQPACGVGVHRGRRCAPPPVTWRTSPSHAVARGGCPHRPMRQHRRQPKGRHHRDLTRNPAHRRCGAVRRGDRGLRIRRHQLAAAAGCCREWFRQRRLSHPDRQYRYSGIEFAGDDRRRHRRQRREDPRKELPRRGRHQGQARRRGSCQRDRESRADQPARVDASGPRPAARRATDGSARAGFDPRLESVIDLPVDRADAVVAVGCDERGRARTDRRLHPQRLDRAVRSRRRRS